MLATDRPEISAIRRAVPEFEETFARELADENGEMGPFQAMSLFARWLAEDGQVDDDAALLERALILIHELRADPCYGLGDALVAEFLETGSDLPALAAELRARGLLV